MPLNWGDKFITDYLHPIFSAKNDSEMFTQMVWISFFYTLSVIISMAVFPAPYGKIVSCLNMYLNKFDLLLGCRTLQQFQIRVSHSRKIGLDDAGVSSLHNSCHSSLDHICTLLEFHSQQGSCHRFNCPLYSEVTST